MFNEWEKMAAKRIGKMEHTKVFIHEILDGWLNPSRTSREPLLRTHRWSLPEQCREEYDKLLAKIVDAEDAISHVMTYPDYDNEKQLALNLLREIRSNVSACLRDFVSPTLLELPIKILTMILTKLPTVTDLTNAMSSCAKLQMAGERVCLGLRYIDMAEAGLGEEILKKHLDKESPILTISHIFQFNAMGLPTFISRILNDPTVMANVTTLVLERCFLHFSETDSFPLTLRKVCMNDCSLEKWPRPSMIRQLGFLQLTPSEDCIGSAWSEYLLSLSSKFVLRADAANNLPRKRLILDCTNHTLSLGEVTKGTDAVVIPHEFILEKWDGTDEKRFFAFGPSANHQALWSHLNPHFRKEDSILFRSPELAPDFHGPFSGFARECDGLVSRHRRYARLSLVRREVLLNRVVITYRLSQKPGFKSEVKSDDEKPSTAVLPEHAREDMCVSGTDTEVDEFQNQALVVKKYLRSIQVEREDLSLHKKAFRIIDEAIRNSSNALKPCDLPREVLVCILSKLQSQRDLDAASKVSAELMRAASMTRMQLSCIDMSPKAILNLQDLVERHVPTTITTCRVKNYTQTTRRLPGPLDKLLRCELTNLKHLTFESCHNLDTSSIPIDFEKRAVEHITFDDCHGDLDDAILLEVKSITVKKLRFPFRGFECLFEASLSLLPAHKSIWTMGVLPEKRIWWDEDAQQLRLACDGPWPQGTPIVVPHEVQLLPQDGHSITYANFFAVGAGEAPERLISFLDSRLLDADGRPKAPLAQMMHRRIFKRFKEECFKAMKNILGEENFRPDRMIVKREVLEDRVLITCKVIS